MSRARKIRLPHGVVEKLRRGVGAGAHHIEKGVGSYNRKKENRKLRQMMRETES